MRPDLPWLPFDCSRLGSNSRSRALLFLQTEKYSTIFPFSQPNTHGV